MIDAAEHETGGPGRLGVNGLHRIDTPNQDTESFLKFDPGERGAEAEVGAEAEGDVRVLGATGIERFGLRERSWIVIGRPEEQADLVSSAERNPVPFQILEHPPFEHLQGRIPPQKLLGSGGQEVRFATESCKDLGVARQSKDRVADGVHGRLVAGVEDEDAGGDEVFVGHVVVCDQLGDEVFAGIGAAR